MRVSIELSIHVGSETPRADLFGRLLRDAMQEYLASRRIKKAQESGQQGGVPLDSDIALARSIASQIAAQIPRITIDPPVLPGR
jgi:hypothetical protein